MNILIVEDDLTDMKLLIAVLDSNGHQVVGKRTAELAVKEIGECRPEMILLDLKLPGISGLELARLLKNNPSTQAIPIVAMTAFSERFNRDEALAAGCDALITKPVDTRQLSNQLKAIAEERR